MLYERPKCPSKTTQDENVWKAADWFRAFLLGNISGLLITPKRWYWEVSLTRVYWDKDPVLRQLSK